jgi:hypothetical protein
MKVRKRRMTENLSEMVEGASAAPSMTEEEVAKVAAEANVKIAEEIQNQIVGFCQTLSEDVKTVSHGNTLSIKHKNRNFVYLTKSKKSPLKVQVKNGKDWPVIALDMTTGFEGLKKVIQDSFNALQ